MNAHDLKSWIAHLEQKGSLKRVSRGVSLRHEVAALSQKADGQTALLFEQTDGAPMPVIANIACKREWYADAMGVAPRELLREVQRRQEIKIKPNVVSKAPFLHNVITKEIDVQKILPLPTYHELDGGPYISAGVFIAQDPDSGVGNVSIHRMHALEPDLFGLLVLPRHLKGMIRRAAERGEPLKAAVCVGLDPLLLMASQLVLAPGEDELETAGGLKGRAVDVAPRPLVGNSRARGRRNRDRGGNSAGRAQARRSFRRVSALLQPGGRAGSLPGEIHRHARGTRFLFHRGGGV